MTELLSAADIADLTTLDESAMNETFTITVVTTVSDGAGSSTTTESSITTRGYFGQPPIGGEAGADQLKAVGRQSIYVLKTAVVAPTAIITQVSTGRKFNVVYVGTLNNYSTSLQLIVEDA